MNSEGYQLLMQSIVEKLEAMELLLQIISNQKPQIDLSSITNQIAAFRKDFEGGNSKRLMEAQLLGDLSQNIKQLQQQLLVPRDSKIEHKHTLHKGIWISVGLALVVVVLVCGWTNSFNSRKQYEEDSIKYRSLKVFGNKSVVRLCVQTDSLYNRNKDEFISQVIQAEQLLFSIADSIRFAGENKGDIKLRKNTKTQH